MKYPPSTMITHSSYSEIKVAVSITVTKNFQISNSKRCLLEEMSVHIYRRIRSQLAKLNYNDVIIT